ncbi:Gfo/Idh/MocA family oxidoreductase [Ramlibacter sp. AW1]|uniref:Gfo/Idh/MocA family oxidoreductase n=1 Tax=Ramlibacter aurantiacus TaxID=2801330 RepID=A0A937D5J1_9BURK|nr:Gfo/Idh/MocA family oxidoreductase [Ramlibacter aurantiacus]MBL0419963.1 Gfo/Idh/MocA family oxidoreductase [Ramlibacter aurantiacus]
MSVQTEIDFADPPAVSPARTPRLGFLGLGWIGQNRLKSLLDAQACEVAVVADPSPAVHERVAQLAPRAASAGSLDELLAHALDGVVIATPSALHAQQALRLLERGFAVFCQKPLARTAAETQAMVDAARRADRLLACDFSYRHTEAMQRVRQAVSDGEIGPVHAVDLVFHNTWGPDKSWARDMALAGGGCAIDLGTHLVDLALWVLGFPAVRQVSSRLYAQGRLLAPGASEVEDYAVAQIDLDGGATVRLACSWNFSGGRDAIIEAAFHGARAGVALRNQDGSFYDFRAERYDGNRSTLLAAPPDDWGGRAIVEWARRLAAGAGYDPAIERAVPVARVLDQIYGR